MRSLACLLVVQFVLLPAVAAAATHQVQVQGVAFNPKDIVVQEGDTIEWVWQGSGQHSITSGIANAGDAGDIFNAPMGAATPTFSWVATEPPGVVDYHCIPHWFLGMNGTITIEPAAAGGVRHDVVVRDFEFDPSPVFIASGDTVCWMWESGFHTVTSGASSNPVNNPGAYFNSPISSVDSVFYKVFDDTTGIVNYFCTPHEAQNMRGVVAVDTGTLGLPDHRNRHFDVLPPFPNPSGGIHHFRLNMAEGANVKAEVFDVQGRLVYVLADRRFEEGSYTLRWEGETLAGAMAAPGIYFVRLRSRKDSMTHKVYRAPAGHHH